MKQEPVAWITTLEKPKDGFITAYAVNDEPFNIPLYTAPKELSDDEINREIRKAFYGSHFNDPDILELFQEDSGFHTEAVLFEYETTSNCEGIECRADLMGLIRAILKKSSEK